MKKYKLSNFIFYRSLYAYGLVLVFLGGTTMRAEVVAWGDSLTYGTGAVGPAEGKSWPVWFTECSGIDVVNKGVGGETSTQIKKRFLAEPELHSAFTVFWVGRNNAYATDVVLADIAEMVVALGHDNYVIVGVTNSASEIKSADPNYPERWKLHLINKLNTQLKETYGEHFVDIRPILVSSYDASQEQDVADNAQDVVPSSLRSDSTHLNDAGYKIVAQAICEQYQSMNQTPAVSEGEGN